MKTTQIAVALALALLVQTTLAPSIAGANPPVDFVLIVVIFAALTRGPVAGLWTGSVAGLLQDGLSGGIIGVSGLTKTIAGVVVGVAASQFLIGTIGHRLAIVLMASMVHGLCYVGVYAVISPGVPVATLDVIAAQAVVNGVVGVLAELGVRLAPAQLERFRIGRRSLTKRHWSVS